MPNDVEAEIADFVGYLERAGHRVTQQRIQIARQVFTDHDHFSVDAVVDRLKKRRVKGVSKATVYRTLSLLEEADMIEGIDVEEGYRLYEHVVNHCHHDHLICVQCKKIIEFADQDLERIQDAAFARAGFRALRHSLRAFGLCTDCLKKPQPRYAEALR